MSFLCKVFTTFSTVVRFLTLGTCLMCWLSLSFRLNSLSQTWQAWRSPSWRVLIWRFRPLTEAKLFWHNPHTGMSPSPFSTWFASTFTTGGISSCFIDKLGSTGGSMYSVVSDIGVVTCRATSPVDGVDPVWASACGIIIERVGGEGFFETLFIWFFSRWHIVMSPL